MILSLGVILAAFMALVFVSCLRRMEMRWSPGWLWALLLVAAACLLFRPDEEVEAGEDAGAYFNTALSFAQHGQLSFEDPALAELKPEERAVFRYGHAGFHSTKDACLWCEDEQMSASKPWFFPGYSLLLSVPAALGFPYGAFWVSPILAILAGLLLAGLAYRLTGVRTAAAVAFVLYVLHPAIVWNARCARAEWPASFLVLAGLVLWSTPMLSGRPASRATGFLAGLSLSAAMLFHITSAYVIGPVILASLWLTRRECFWAAWWAGLAVGACLFAIQIVWVTDPYWIKNSLADPRRSMLLLSMGASALVAVAVLRLVWSRVGKHGWIANAVVGGAMSLLFIVLVLLSLRFRTEDGQIPGLPPWAVAYISLTDFSGVMKVSSRFWFAAALLGAVVLCVRRDTPGRLGRWLFFLLAPASLTIGWVNNYMFETRRMVTFLVPLLVLSLSVLLAVIGAGAGRWLNRRGSKTPAWVPGVVICVLAAGLLLMSIRGRLPLYTTWNNEGTFGFYQKVSDRVAEAGDFLFAEYTQTAAPIERLANRPLLPVAWGYRSEAEYRAAEQIMARLVTAQPGRRYLLITPFSGVALPGVSVELLFSDTLHTRRLERLKRTVPTNVTERVRALQVYRVGGEPAAANSGYVRIMDGGRLGLSGGANPVSGRPIEFRGVAVPADGSKNVRFTAPGKVAGPFDVAFVFGVPSGGVPDRLSVDRADSTTSSLRRVSLGPGWEVVELDGETRGRKGFEFEIAASEGVYLCDAFCIPQAGGEAVRLQAEAPQEPFVVEQQESQWLRANASLALPVASASSRVWLLATHGRDGDPAVDCEIGLSGAARLKNRIGSGWTWSVFALPGVPGESGAFRWHDLVTIPAWDPEKSGFPKDLGLRVQRVCVTQ